MEITRNFKKFRTGGRAVMLLLLGLMLTALSYGNALAFTLNVVDGKTGTAIPNTVGYRWLLEEDATHHVLPGNSGTNWGTKFHKSYMPVISKDHAQGQVNIVVPNASKHYYVSVLPNSGYSMGGAQVAPGQADVTVYVQKNPIPTAQISVFVFHDNNPINNAPDLPEETPGIGDGQTDMSGFTVKVEDAGGRYGISAGEAFQNAFGHPIGTTYTPGCDPNVGGDSCIATLGQGFLLTGPDGQVVFENMAPGKYGVFVIPPAGQGWQQTNTIEGKKIIDAWVKANEPIFFAEFGPPGWHAFFGFTKEFNNIPAPSGVAATIKGTVVNNHLSRPPDTAFYDGAVPPHTTPWVGLNANGGLGPALFVQRTNGGYFEIPSVPPGDYQLAVFDDNMDLIFNFLGVTVNPDGTCATPNGSCNLGNVPTFDWFSKIWAYVFEDSNQNGLWESGETGIPDKPVNLRWRDGTMYQSFPTDGEGYAPFDEVFPFFSWLTAEVDFASMKATGAFIVPDAGGQIDSTDPLSFGGQLNPQEQESGDFFRVETGPVLTQAFQGFLGQTSVIQFGKTDYGPGPDENYGTADDENGGISGVVYYSVTRAEDDPKWGAPEVWEPGIPDVTVNLYDSTGITLLATTTTDNWDASLPTDCPGDNAMPLTSGVGPNDCFDGMRNWNQVRPGIFDGGYAFGPDIDCNPTSPDFIFASQDLCLANTIEFTNPITDLTSRYLKPGQYVVEVVPPTDADGNELYAIVKSQDRNVDFGDTFIPQPDLVPPECVGSEYPVPTYLTFNSDGEDPLPGVPMDDLVGAPLATKQLPLCDRKLVTLGGADNAAADFFLFTEVPISAHIVGFILDDTGNEFDPNSPQFGEKYAPPWMPVGIYDWTGRLIGETISDQWGRYNALVPSTHTQNLPMPSGTSPNMLTTCMNDPNTSYGEAQFNPQYSTFCYTFQYMPGSTTYLDTPVVPVAAFAGPDQFGLDCDLPDGTPKIYSVSVNGSGPYIETSSVTSGPPASRGVFTVGSHEIIIKSMGDPFGFGTSAGTVTLGDLGELNCDWGDSITCTVAANTRIGDPGSERGRQLTVTRGDNGLSTVNGVTVQVGLRPGAVVRTVDAPFNDPNEYPTSIQEAIDVAGTNDLILVPPGIYNEFVIMWKPVQLQGWGAGSTIINAVKGFAAERLAAWRARVEELVTTGAVDLLPGQEVGFGGIEPVTFFTEEGAGVLVAGQASGTQSFGYQRLQGNSPQDNWGARIDGLTIRGADQGGGIVASGYIDYLDVSNNVIKNNSGFFGGGFRSGHPTIDNALVDSDNDNIRVRYNMITLNGGLGGAGGGVSMCTGSDNYQVTDNFICGNFALTDGGGIGHLGLSQGGWIAYNDILFNESFNQGLTVHGGGIFIGGGGVPVGQLTPGSGSVTIEANRIHGNLAGAGDGAGIALVRVNGQDVEDNRNKQELWYGIDVFDNIISNNVAALAGGGMVLRDVVKANIVHNTVARNDSMATAGNAFSPGSPNQSNPQPAGIVSRAHSTELNAALDQAGNQVPDNLKRDFSNPRLANSIVWQNRSFYFSADPDEDPPVYTTFQFSEGWDLAVIGSAGSLTPENCILTTDGDPLLIDAYYNVGGFPTVILPEPQFVAAAFDEGGNWIQVRFGPLTLDDYDLNTLYHLENGSSAIDAGINLNSNYPALADDFDGDARPQGTGVDIGADEVPVAQ
jgi:large repetitive protein